MSYTYQAPPKFGPGRPGPVTGEDWHQLYRWLNSWSQIIQQALSDVTCVMGSLQEFNPAGIPPQTLVDNAANLSNYNASSFAQGTFFFAWDTKALYVSVHPPIVGAAQWIQQT